MPTDLSLAHEALKQWEKVGAFRQKMQSFDNPVFYAEYAGESGFLERLQQDHVLLYCVQCYKFLYNRGYNSDIINKITYAD